MNKLLSIVKASTLDGSLTVNSGSNIFGDEEAQTLLNIIENERLTGDFVNGTIMEIILEEARDYFDDKNNCIYLNNIEAEIERGKKAIIIYNYFINQIVYMLVFGSIDKWKQDTLENLYSVNA